MLDTSPKSVSVSMRRLQGDRNQWRTCLQLWLKYKSGLISTNFGQLQLNKKFLRVMVATVLVSEGNALDLVS